MLISGLDAEGGVEYIGSGSIIRPDGLILTNAHIGAPSAPGLPVQYGIGTSKADPAKLQVAVFEGEAKPAKAMYLATPVAYDGYIDAAVLQITETLDGKPVSGLDLPTVPVVRSDELGDGEPVTVVWVPGRRRRLRGPDQRLAGDGLGLPARLAHRHPARLDQDRRGTASGQLGWPRRRLVGPFDRHTLPHSVWVESLRQVPPRSRHAGEDPAHRPGGAGNPRCGGGAGVADTVRRGGNGQRALSVGRLGG